jgi:hypothetical protein
MMGGRAGMVRRGRKNVVLNEQLDRRALVSGLLSI